MSRLRNRKDCLELLGLNPSASKEDIKKAYRKLAKLYHPDLNENNKNAKNQFINIQEAYEFLMNKEYQKNSFEDSNPFVNKDYFSPFQNSIFDEIFKMFNSIDDNLFQARLDPPEAFVDIKKILKERERKII